MRSRVASLLVFCAAVLPAWQTADAASLRVTASESSAMSPSAVRRAERLRNRLEQTRNRPVPTRSNAADARRETRLRARARTAAPTRTSTRASTIERVLELVNDARRKEDLPSLSWNETLATTAQAYAEDMATRGFFSHDDPEGGTPKDRILRGGYAKPSCNCSWTYGTGENLAQGQDTPEKVMADWLASPGHRANIMSEDFEDIGIGYADEHWVQHFGVSKVLP
jgi:uncharacterized protein YkwD